MAKGKRAKRVTSRSRTARTDATENMPARAAESLTEIAATSGAQAMRFAAAVARGMARGVASAAREMRRPVRDSAEAAREAAQTISDVAAEGVEAAAEAGRAGTARRRGRSPSSKRRRA